MSRGLAIAAACLVAALPAAALAAGGSHRVYVTDCTHARFKPKTIVIACGDGSRLVEKLKWSSWTRAGASGKGTYAVNPCKPDCARGHFKTYAVAVTLAHPARCRKVKRSVFETMTLRYTRRHAKPEHVELGCPYSAGAPIVY